MLMRLYLAECYLVLSCICVNISKMAIKLSLVCSIVGLLVNIKAFVPHSGTKNLLSEEDMQWYFS